MSFQNHNEKKPVKDVLVDGAAENDLLVITDQVNAKVNVQGFLDYNDVANLDESHMWPIAFALKELTAAEEARIGALVKKAVS